MRTSRYCLIAAVLLSAAPSQAFCRTTTCQPGECQPNPTCHTCLEGGRPLFWKSRCVSFAVDAVGAPSRGIAPDVAHQTIAGAFVKWMSADCQGKHTSLSVLDLGTVHCDGTDFDRSAENLNLWTFRDQSWPHAGRGAMLALTTVTYDAPTGEILDADVEINSFDNPITLDDDHVIADLDAILTHEAGHFLGLSHSCEPGATMYPSYSMGSTDMRELSVDDTAAICAVFPPGMKKACAPEPIGGVPSCATDAPDTLNSRGCQQSRASSQSPLWLSLPLVLGLVGWRRQRVPRWL